MPVGAESYSQALEMSVAMYRAVGAVTSSAGLKQHSSVMKAVMAPEAARQRAGPRYRRRCDACPADSSPAATWPIAPGYRL